MAKIIIDVCWEDKKFVEEIVKENYEPGSMLDMEIRMGLKEAVVVSSEQEIVKPVLDKIRAEIDNINLNEVVSKYENGLYGFQQEVFYGFWQEVLKILDKYKTESEEQNNGM